LIRKRLGPALRRILPLLFKFEAATGFTIFETILARLA
jgi:hypothetical protein